LVLGIVSIYPLFFIGFIPGIIAIALGMKHRREARELGEEPSAMNTAGWICGILGTIFGFLIWLFIILAAIGTSHSSSNGY
jgi:hypothetical protein